MKHLRGIQTTIVIFCMFQELKLNMLLAESLPLLSQLLHQLACDLHLQEYVLHYWKDFPFHCPLVTCTLVRLWTLLSYTAPSFIEMCCLQYQIGAIAEASNYSILYF